MKVKQMKNQEMKGEKEQMKQIKMNERGLKEEKMKRLSEQGITLVALVVTIVIILILAGVVLNSTLGDNGLISKAKRATEKYQEAQENEAEYLNIVADEIEDANLGLNVKAKINGETIKLTKENFGKYLGMKITNFKNAGEGTEAINVKGIQFVDETKDTKVKISTTYRLYYIDFDNKYGDGAGTIYLKADCPSYDKFPAPYTLLQDNTDIDAKTAEGRNKVKIKQLNPCLYVNNTPNKEKSNIKKVIGLLNEDNWSELKDNIKEGVSEKLNYIVGAPSIEMMFDSYNTHYNLEGDEPVKGRGDGVTRKKLFYKLDENGNGYNIGPTNSYQYMYQTFEYTFPHDEIIDPMYTVADGSWIVGSPCTITEGSVSGIQGDWLFFVCDHGNTAENSVIISYGEINTTSESPRGRAFCPLVSLKSSFNIELEGQLG